MQDVLKSQLEECTPDLFEQIGGSNTCFLSVLLYDFFENCFDHGDIMTRSGGLKPLPGKCRELQLFVQKKFEWYPLADEGYTIVE